MWRQRFSRPDNELPGAAAICLLLGRTDDLAVGITTVEAYSTGFSFNLAVRLRDERGGFGLSMYELIAGHGHPHANPPAANERLLLGLEYADGRTATNLNPMPFPADPRAGGLPDDEVVLAPSGGGGGGRAFDQGYWVAPLPSPGPLTFVCAWPALGIAEAHTRMDATLIIDAAARARVLWPRQPDEPQPPPPPPTPPPSSGWFADAVRRRPEPGRSPGPDPHRSS
jgi:hypothetical protein